MSAFLPTQTTWCFRSRSLFTFRLVPVPLSLTPGVLGFSCETPGGLDSVPFAGRSGCSIVEPDEVIAFGLCDETGCS